MKNLSFLLISLFVITVASNAYAQGDKSKRPSPPMTASGQVDDLKIEINYGAPSVKGRKIYGSLEPYGKVWRTGANEATTFSVNKDVTINGEALPAGKYALFTIPTEGEWTIIFNKNPNQWGAYSYNKEEDALRIQVKPSKSDKLQEQLMFKVKDDGNVHFKWEYQSFAFAVNAQ